MPETPPAVEIESDEPDDSGEFGSESAASPLILGPLLRHVDDTSATIWVETTRPAEVSVLGHSTRTFAVDGHHYALVMVEGLEPGTTTPYEVAIDDLVVWPERGSDFPPSAIRTTHPDLEPLILLGSCRAAAPHHPPYSLERTLDHEARGVDALWAHAHRMREQPPEQWPDLLLLVGDQIYADDSSPGARERIERRRDDQLDLPASVVADYEEYCLLYHEAWSQEAERWLLSTVPSAMIFDDHDMIDDWNISGAWMRDVREEPWWREHNIAGLVSYLVYQHLGNLSPAALREEAILENAVEAGDATDLLEKWANELEQRTPLVGGYQFSHRRQLGDTTVVVIDCRNGRVFDDEQRLMVGPQEWEWVRSQCLAAEGNLVIATSLPIFIADGLHDLHVWNERVCAGAWGGLAARVGERIRRGLDLEDWAAFETSYRQCLDLLRDLADGSCRSVVVASGDIHFSYAATVGSPHFEALPVWQVVSSPIRNALVPPERGVMRATLTNTGRRVGALLRRAVRAPDTRPNIEMLTGPFFANAMCLIDSRRDHVRLLFEQSAQDPDGPARLDEVACLRLSIENSRKP